LRQGKAEHENVQDNRKDHKAGPPYLPAWVIVVKYLSKDDNNSFESYWNVAARRPREALEMEITLCRAKQAYDKKFFKVTGVVENTGIDFEKAVVGGMPSLGGIKNIGLSPAGCLEREAARLVEKF
jgi:hypothetical protein